MKDANIDLNETNKNTGLAALTHILGLLTGIFGPILIYLLSDDEFVKENAARSITWQLFFTLYFILSFIMSFFVIGLFFLPILGLADLIFSIIATMKASEGEAWKYPGTIDLIVNSTENKKEHINSYNFNQEKSEESRIEELKQMYLNGEITEEEFDNLVDMNLDKKREENEFDMSYEK